LSKRELNWKTGPYNAITLMITTKYLRRYFIYQDVKAFNPTGRVLEIGSGKHWRYVDGSITINKDPTAEPDIIMHAENMPFENEFDSILAIEVLEHTLNPQKLVDQIYKALIGGGRCLITVPFCFEVHSCEDYWRFTKSGLEYLFRNFNNLRIKHHGGIVCVIGHYLRITPLGYLLYPMINNLSFWLDKLTCFGEPRITLGYGVIAEKPTDL